MAAMPTSTASERTMSRVAMLRASASTGALASNACAEGRVVEEIDHPRQHAARQRHAPGRDEGHRHVAGEARHDPPVEREARRRLALRVGERRRGDRGGSRCGSGRPSAIIRARWTPGEARPR